MNKYQIISKIQKFKRFSNLDNGASVKAGLEFEYFEIGAYLCFVICVL